MLLLSLGPEAVAALLRGGENARHNGPFSGPDLAWLLFGPDMGGGTEAQDTAPVLAEIARLRTSG